MYVALIIIGINTHDILLQHWTALDGRRTMAGLRLSGKLRRTRLRLENGYSMRLIAANARQAALQRDASARGNYKDVDLDATV